MLDLLEHLREIVAVVSPFVSSTAYGDESADAIGHPASLLFCGGKMKNEFDLGWKSCEEEKVAPLYAAIEDAISDLSPLAKENTHDANYLHSVIVALRKALKESDK